jgi:hypothetical protein
VVEVRTQDTQGLETPDGSHLQIRRTEHEPRDPRVDGGPEAHEARLHRAVQSRVDQPIVSQAQGGVPQGENFSVSGRVVQRERCVVPTPDDLAPGHHDRTDGHLPGGPRERGFLESYPHEVLMLVHRL